MKNNIRAGLVVTLTVVAVAITMGVVFWGKEPEQAPPPPEPPHLEVFEKTPTDGTGVPAKPVFFKVTREVVE